MKRPALGLTLLSIVATVAACTSGGAANRPKRGARSPSVPATPSSAAVCPSTAPRPAAHGLPGLTRDIMAQRTQASISAGGHYANCVRASAEYATYTVPWAGGIIYTVTQAGDVSDVLCGALSTAAAAPHNKILGVCTDLGFLGEDKAAVAAYFTSVLDAAVRSTTDAHPLYRSFVRMGAASYKWSITKYPHRNTYYFDLKVSRV